MSVTITPSGFVPGSGAGAMVLESLESALKREAKIYGEVLGGNLNSGGQRDGGTLTSPNSKAVQKCILDAMKDANIKSSEIDAINGMVPVVSAEVGLSAPYNETLAAVIRRREEAF